MRLEVFHPDDLLEEYAKFSALRSENGGKFDTFLDTSLILRLPIFLSGPLQSVFDYPDLLRYLEHLPKDDDIVITTNNICRIMDIHYSNISGLLCKTSTAITDDIAGELQSYVRNRDWQIKHGRENIQNIQKKRNVHIFNEHRRATDRAGIGAGEYAHIPASQFVGRKKFIKENIDAIANVEHKGISSIIEQSSADRKHIAKICETYDSVYESLHTFLLPPFKEIFYEKYGKPLGDQRRGDISILASAVTYSMILRWPVNLITCDGDFSELVVRSYYNCGAALLNAVHRLGGLEFDIGIYYSTPRNYLRGGKIMSAGKRLSFSEGKLEIVHE